METLLKEVTVRNSFEFVVEELAKRLHDQGFLTQDAIDFHNDSLELDRISDRKYAILPVYSHQLSKEMVALFPTEGVILPCYVSVIENYPGEIQVILYNPMHEIARELHNQCLDSFASEVTSRILGIIHTLQELNVSPDLVTSWE